jgi:hypothetical protein
MFLMILTLYFILVSILEYLSCNEHIDRNRNFVWKDVPSTAIFFKISFAYKRDIVEIRDSH